MCSHFLPQDLREEFRGAIEDLGMVHESLGAAQVSQDLQYPGDPLQISQVLFRLGEGVQDAGTECGLALLYADIPAYLSSLIEQLPLYKGELSRDEEEIPLLRAAT